MINLLSPSQKADIRASRLNVRLRRASLLCLSALLIILGIYGVGFFFVQGDRITADKELATSKLATEDEDYKKVVADAKGYKTNLTIADKVLSSGVSYSSFVIETARILPAGTVLTGLTLSNLGAPATGANAATANSLTLLARTTSYDVALQLQKNLENSELYEKVSISDASILAENVRITNADKKYPVSLTVKARISKIKAGS